MVFVKSWTFWIGVLLSVFVKGVIIDCRQGCYYRVDFESFVSNCFIFITNMKFEKGNSHVISKHNSIPCHLPWRALCIPSIFGAGLNDFQTHQVHYDFQTHQVSLINVMISKIDNNTPSMVLKKNWTRGGCY